MRRRAQGLTISLSIVVGVMVLLTLVLHSTLFHRALLKTIQKGTGIEINLKESRLQLYRGAITLNGLSVRDPEKYQITTDRLFLNFSPLSLLRGKIIVSDLELDSPVIEIQPTGKKLNPQLFLSFFETFERSFILQNLILDRIQLHDLHLRVGEKTFRVADAFLRVAPNLLREIELEVRLADASGIAPILQSLEAKIAVKKERLKIKKFFVKTSKIAVDFKGEGDGNLQRGSFSLEGRLEAPTVLPEVLGFAAEGGLDQKVIRFKKIQAHLGQGLLEGKGEYSLDRRAYDIPFTATNVSLESIFQKLTSKVLNPSQGIGEVEGRAKGTLPEMIAEADAKIRDFHNGGLASRGAVGKLSLHWPELNFDADIQPGGERTEAHLIGGVVFKKLPEPGGPERLQGMLKNLELRFDGSSLADLLPTLGASGKLDGILNLRGTQENSVEGTGHGKITDGRFPFGEVPFLESDVTFRPGGQILFSKNRFQLSPFGPAEWPGPVEIDASGPLMTFRGTPSEGIGFRGSYRKESRLVRIDSLQIRRDGSLLEGAGNFTPGGSIDAHLRGGLNLESLLAVPSIFHEGQGIAQVDLAASGPLREPIVRGVVHFHQNEIGIRGFPQTISNLEGDLRIDGNQIFSKITGLLGDGTFQAGGSLTLSHWRAQEFQLVLKGENLTLFRTNRFKIDFDADVSLRGALPSPRLAGRIDIVDGLYTKNFEVRELVLRPFEESGEPAPWEKKINETQLDLVIKNSGDLRVKNNIATLLLRSDLRVQGTYGHPRITGFLVASPEGSFHYLGEDFILTEGRLEYLPFREEPYLTFMAFHEIPERETTLFVEIKGYLSNLQVDLISSPPQSRANILSLLAVGKTQEEIRQIGDTQRSLLSKGLIAEEISTAIAPLSRRTGLDILRLEASEKGTLSVLSVGKNLTDRFSLEFRSDVAPQTADRSLQANYYLTDNILLKGFRSQEAGQEPRYQFNVSFRFRLY